MEVPNEKFTICDFLFVGKRVVSGAEPAWHPFVWPLSSSTGESWGSK